ncbi:hypothetical protein A3A71_00265 [Candidatus Berkelbacteria bacterium RIFCSPLOWO2_01_FULL_50_28]|uniref:DUF420 domain-containing protein n=1 Tax=Candidatus Berkelbacteria bacterium RIFCSPLOWO2_01_FULL_50_28 TaxID=1797471 RepID=A0A1F5EAS8_9BACT|nr:MAG: hypothetical protein A2807_00195 [Candidatus Berkelbacteria bacterium RIFCSPHIGHO2_01_FULL_50_36]OGD62827.1 MAG: hypothetical protein A3F39_02270 [Candidatus Berkelbacteria bacterium RIFCSPHIGHO2_12_FULL_50_11]OGD64483.1 MAG: hypothetical protein A3A71_00265 [Candidatus Berkelbacteria bacterium RIFCSPLOWO2_01_FULL_50_28]
MLYLLIFVALLILFVGFFIWTAIAGRRHQRRRHVLRAWVTVTIFVATVLYAEGLRYLYSFNKDAQTIHLPFAITSGVIFLVLVLLGWKLQSGNRFRVWHRAAVITFAVMLIPTTITGILLITTAAPR